MDNIGKNPNEIPIHWLDTVVISIYKNKGSCNNSNNYRSIFLLDTIGKVYAGMIGERLKALTEQNLPPNQFRVRKRLSITHAITAIRHNTRWIICQPRTNTDFHWPHQSFQLITKENDSRYITKLCPSNNINRNITQLLGGHNGYKKGTQLHFTMYRSVQKGIKESRLSSISPFKKF